MSKREVPLPKWREDFPFETEGDDFITRRDLLRFLTLVSGGLAAGNAAVWLSAAQEADGPQPEMHIAESDALAPGSWKVFRYPDERTPAILIRRTNGELIAFHQKCPHLACPVSYDKGDSEFGESLRCHCHNGRFDVGSGKGVQGPPRELRPLRQILVEERGGWIVAVGVKPHHST